MSALRISNSTSFTDSVGVGNLTVRSFFQSAKNLGVTPDMRLTMAARVVNLIRTVNFKLRRISSTRHYLSIQATQILVAAFVLPWLDEANSLLSGCPQHILNRLQKVQINAGRLVLKAPWTGCIALHLCTLHWHPIDARIKYKMSFLCLRALTSTGPV